MTLREGDVIATIDNFLDESRDVLDPPFQRSHLTFAYSLFDVHPFVIILHSLTATELSRSEAAHLLLGRGWERGGHVKLFDVCADSTHNSLLELRGIE